MTSPRNPYAERESVSGVTFIRSHQFLGGMAAPLFLLLLLSSTGAAQEPRPADIKPNAATVFALDGAARGSVAIVVGERGHILRSTDNGDTWTQVESPVSSMLTAVTMLSDGRVWAVGHDAIILRSLDGGVSWTVQNFDPGLETPLLRASDKNLDVAYLSVFSETNAAIQSVVTDVKNPRFGLPLTYTL